MAEFEGHEGVWRTIGGRRVFIRDGEDLSSAMQRSGKFSRVQKNQDLYKKLDEEKKKIDEKIEKKEDSEKKEKIELSKQLAREIYGKGISDEKAETYGKELLQPPEGAIIDDYADWELDKEKLEWTKEGLQNRLTYLTKGYDASKEEGERFAKEYAEKHGTKEEKGLELNENQKQAGERLNTKAENGVRNDIKDFLSGRENYEGTQEEFENDLSKEWGVDKGVVEDILHEEMVKHPRNFKNDKKETNDKSNDTKQEKDKTSFTQKVDIDGGEYTYDADRLKRMEEHGTKPMANSYTGGGWEGTKYDSTLSTKDIAKNISDYSKKEFPDVKISRKTDYNGIDINIMSSGKDLYANEADIDKMSDRQVSDTIRDSIGGYTRLDEWLNKNNRKNANGAFTTKDERDYLKEELKTYKNRNGYNVSGNEWYLSDYGKKVVSGLNKEMNSYNYDDSDGMVDYFNTNFYGYVKIGKWDKPYETTTNKKSMNDALRQKGYQKYMKEHPASKMTFDDYMKMNKK